MNPNARRRTIMLLAHSLRVANHWPMSTALCWAWKMERARLCVQAVGVTFGRRQEALRRLSRYPADMTALGLVQEPGNAHDPHAVAVVASVRGLGSVTVGYLPRRVAAILAPLMDRGQALRVCGWTTAEGGLRITLAFGQGRERAARLRIA